MSAFARKLESPGPSREGLHVLVVDDEKHIRFTLCVCLEALGNQAVAVPTGQAAIEALGHHSFDVAFLDLRLGTENGIDLMPRLLEASPNLPIILMTAHAAVQTAVEAIRRGAWDYLPKPFTPAQIEHLIGDVSRQRFAAAPSRRPWPGDVRGLHEVMERAVTLSPEQLLEPRAPPQRRASTDTSSPFLGGDYSLEEIEREHVLQVLARTTRFENAATILGIDTSTLWRKRRKYNRPDS